MAGFLPRDVTMVSFSIERRLGVLDDGEEFALTVFYDEDGGDAEPSEAVGIGGRLRDGSWIVFDISTFVDATVN